MFKEVTPCLNKYTFKNQLTYAIDFINFGADAATEIINTIVLLLLYDKY